MRNWPTILILVLAFLAILIFIYFNKNNFLAKGQNINMANNEIRSAAVAGSFYPSQKNILKENITTYLENASTTSGSWPRIIFIPHAGYEYSAGVAAASFKTLVQSQYRRVIILGPSHHYPVSGLILASAKFWQTPLGQIKVSVINEALSQETDFRIDDSIHAPEHAIEIELPFLQTILPDVEIVPIIVGQLNATQRQNFGKILEKYFDEQTLIIVSVDLSHYHPAAQAKALDEKTITDILNFAEDKILNEDEIDAPWAVASILNLAQRLNLKPKLLSYKNSGDITGDQSAVVGYGAFGFYQSQSVDEYTLAEKKELLQIARQTIQNYFATGKRLKTETGNQKFLAKRGVFVTLNLKDKLRGCIGYIEPIKPLVEAIIDNAYSAAFEDNRFLPLTEDELDDIKIEISVLTEPKPDSIENIIHEKKGAILRRGNKGATYLPQVWEDLNDPKVFFTTLCQKGGLAADCYLDSDVSVLSYQAIVFHE